MPAIVRICRKLGEEGEELVIGGKGERGKWPCVGRWERTQQHASAVAGESKRREGKGDVNDFQQIDEGEGSDKGGFFFLSCIFQGRSSSERFSWLKDFPLFLFPFRSLIRWDAFMRLI